MRVDDSPPFAVTDVYFTGALSIRESSGSEKKVYIFLFTCASKRNVHLEVAPNLTEDAFMNLSDDSRAESPSHTQC
ncbi:hypothetical protein DPMN_032266 [Dreissena polymorpha]|uniref:Uncharacterized protein n=1 Tax=Dreissena polymorpha TaxID=45954 RepID=A0A9D4M1E8_DREPO|nr:hypothetical protein DPMN_032266 [Dreissena polymorpha]